MLVSNKKLAEIINKITPFYNNYLKNKRDLNPYQSIEIMWEMGGALFDFINQENIKPHSLYRMIYGKSEGTSDIEQKSYITREFQGRCVRIRKIFNKKKDIKDQLFSLKSFTSFRECMPFFDNQKFKFKGNEMKELLSLLNGPLNSSDQLKVIRKLQRKKIGIKNDRKQRLKDFDNEKQIFIDFYNKCYQLIKLKDYQKGTLNIDKRFYEALSKNTSSLWRDGYKSYPFSIPDSASKLEQLYGELILFFISKNTNKEIRRFRNIIPPDRISRLSEMLFALTNVNSYQMF